MSAAARAFSEEEVAENDEDDDGGKLSGALPLTAIYFMTVDEQDVIIALVAQMKGEMPKDTLISMVKGIILIDGMVGEEDIDDTAAKVTQNLIETRSLEEEMYDGIDYVFVDSDDSAEIAVSPVLDNPDDKDTNASIDENV